jgi:Transposase DDE domain
MNQEARKVFNTIEALLPSKHQRKSLRVITNAFLEANGQPRPEHAIGKSASALSRFLNQYQWNLRALIRAVRNAITQRLVHASHNRRGRKPLLELILDLTTLEKVGDFPELPVSVLNDVKGLHLIVLYVVVGKERFPWSFLIWRGKDTIKPSNLALRLLSRIPAWFKNLFQIRVLADGGFGSAEFIEGCVELVLPAVVGMRCDRRVRSTGFAESTAAPGTRLETLNVRGEQVKLADCSVPVWASWFKLKRSNGTFEWRYVISTVRADAVSIVRWGRRRWQIESFFKTMKSRFGLDQFGQRTALGALRFITLSFMAFLLAFWTALEVGWVLLDWRVMANAARDAIMPEVRLVVLEAEVLRLRALQAAQEIA